MSNTNKKNPAGATNTNEGNESIPKTSLIAYMHRRGHNNGHSYGTWSGEKLAFEDHTTLVVHWDSFVNAAVNGSATFHINRECIDKYNAHVYELRAKEEAEAKRAAERNAAEREEVELIERITGEKMGRQDLDPMIAECIRSGKDLQPFLDAIEAVDSLDLKRAGLTSWTDPDDEEGES